MPGILILCYCFHNLLELSSLMLQNWLQSYSYGAQSCKMVSTEALIPRNNLIYSI